MSYQLNESKDVILTSKLEHDQQKVLHNHTPKSEL